MSSSATMSPAAPARHAWSDEQEAVFDRLATPAGHLVVVARAGTGKTTTIVEGIRRSSAEAILFAAFNKSAAAEGARRITHPGAESTTLHAAGMRLVTMMWERVRVDAWARADGLAEEACGPAAPGPIVRAVSRIHTLGREILPLTATAENLAQLAWAHELMPSEEWASYGWGEGEVIAAALRAMEAAKARSAVIDFADMIYLPLVHNWIRPLYDLVIVDEAQDMTWAQLTVARLLCRGWMMLVGDDRQAIYTWRGAAPDGLLRMADHLGADRLTLTTTYRCPRAVVDVARSIVPDYRAAPTAPEGVVRTIAGVERVLDEAQPGDAVLSRVNAPLVALCLSAFKRGIPARIEGKDVLKGLQGAIRDITKKKTLFVEEFLARLDRATDREVRRAMLRGGGGAEERAGELMDRAMAVRALCDGLTTTAELERRLEQIFAAADVGSVVTFSSVHRAKGLEWSKVFLLKDTFKMTPPDPEKVRPERVIEEQNLYYVGVTRAMRELVLVLD